MMCFVDILYSLLFMFFVTILMVVFGARSPSFVARVLLSG